MAQKILIVDDEAVVARSMQKTLIRAGFEAQVAANCTDGLKMFEAGGFALALLDLNMPGFDGAPAPDAGLTLLSKIHERNATFPVIILSAYDDASKAKEAVSRGARGFNIKGREQHLLDELKSILQG
jgi:two-component system OmpR family response regulator